jgi:hypothetical protein
MEMTGRGVEGLSESSDGSKKGNDGKGLRVKGLFQQFKPVVLAGLD